jgi:hypothetical protein
MVLQKLVHWFRLPCTGRKVFAVNGHENAPAHSGRGQSPHERRSILRSAAVVSVPIALIGALRMYIVRLFLLSGLLAAALLLAGLFLIRVLLPLARTVLVLVGHRMISVSVVDRAQNIQNRYRSETRAPAPEPGPVESSEAKRFAWPGAVTGLRLV